MTEPREGKDPEEARPGGEQPASSTEPAKPDAAPAKVKATMAMEAIDVAALTAARAAAAPAQKPADGATPKPPEAATPAPPVEARSDNVEATLPGIGPSGEGAGEVAASDDAPPGIHITYFGQTDVGLVREHNEDNFLVTDLSDGSRGIQGNEIQKLKLGPKGAIFAVCDGMGGAAAGEVASQMAVDTIFQVTGSAAPAADRDSFARLLVRCIEEAGNRIFSAAKMDRSRRGMGTTSTVAGMVDKVLFVGQVGDSRCYVLRGNSFQLVTKDQSLVNQLIDAGQLTAEEAEAFEHSNIILQALGTTEDVQVDLTFLEMRRGDRLLLCSDGLSGLVHSEMMKEVLTTTPDLAECCRKLIEMARNGGGHDNITVICAEVGGADLAPPDSSIHPAYQQYPLPLEGSRDTGPAREPGSGRKVDPRRDFEDVTPVLPRNGMGEMPSRAFPWWIIVVLLAAIAVGTVVAFAMSSADQTQPQTDALQLVMDAAITDTQRFATVRVKTDLPQGDLYIDGQLEGPFGDTEVTLEMDPGAYRFELRSNGNVVATATRTVRASEQTEIELMMPSGFAATDAVDAAAAQQGGNQRPEETPRPPNGAEGTPPSGTQPSGTQGGTTPSTTPTGATAPTGNTPSAPSGNEPARSGETQPRPSGSETGTSPSGTPPPSGAAAPR